MSHIFTFLSNEFYIDYPKNKFGEIERKPDRHYIQVCVKINGNLFAVPLRSQINHPFVLWTDRANRCGVDFSKAVVVTDEKYIDKTRTPFIRPYEFRQLIGKEHIIKVKMERYIEKYKRAKDNTKHDKDGHCLFPRDDSWMR